MPNPVKGATNTTCTYNSNDLTSFCSQADLQATLDSIDVTNLASTGTETISPITTWTIPLQGFWDATVDGYLAPDAVTPGTKRTAVITFTDAASSTVTYTWTSNAEVGNYQISSQPKQAITFSAELRLSGAPVRS